MFPHCILMGLFLWQPKVFISETEQDRAILTKFLLTASKQQALASL